MIEALPIASFTSWLSKLFTVVDADDWYMTSVMVLV